MPIMKIYAEMVLNARSVQQSTLVDLFAQYGCPVGVGLRVAEDLLRDGHRKMTLLASLDFAALAADLAKHSVTLLIHSKLKQKRR